MSDLKNGSQIGKFIHASQPLAESNGWVWTRVIGDGFAILADENGNALARLGFDGGKTRLCYDRPDRIRRLIDLASDSGIICIATG